MKNPFNNNQIEQNFTTKIDTVYSQANYSLIFVYLLWLLHILDEKDLAEVIDCPG